MKNFDELLSHLDKLTPRTMVVAGAEEVEVLHAVCEARDRNIARGYLVGDSQQILDMAHDEGLSLHDFDLVSELNRGLVAKTAAKLAQDHQASMMVKGTVGSADFLRSILDKERGFVKGKLLSHVGVIEAKGYDRLFFLTDGAMNIAPSLEQKVTICQNAIDMARALGVDPVRVAVIAALESVNPDMPATVDGAILSKMADRGQIKGGIVDGPLAMDNAVSPKAAEMKGVGGAVAGAADVLLVPTIEVGNTVYKTMVYFSTVRAAGIVVGATIPIVLNSRSDSHENRFLSLALGAFLSR